VASDPICAALWGCGVFSLKQLGRKGDVARKKTSSLRVSVKAQIAGRLREIRQELFGEHGGPELARRLNLPARTWYNYETGVTVPAEVLLSFIDQTGANPEWLLSGNGPRYHRGLEDSILSELTPQQLIRRGLEKLEQEPQEVVLVMPDNLPQDDLSDFVAIDLVCLADLVGPASARPRADGHVLAYRQWIPHVAETVAVQIDDDSMHPILPEGSVVAVDRASRNPDHLHGKLVAAAPGGKAMIRWLEISGRHLILRPNQPGRDFPMIPVDLTDPSGKSLILGQVVWSWSRFASD
jgi:SOS-response transcriptional repressor LexA